MKLSTARFYQFEQVAFLQNFTWDQALNTPHPTGWLNAVWPELFQGILHVILMSSCSLLGRTQMQQLMTRNCHICVPKSAYQHPVHLKGEKGPGQNSKTRPKVVCGKETSEIGFVTGREKKWRGLRGARRGRGGRKGWDRADNGQGGVPLSDLDGWGWDGEEIKPETRYHY